MSIVDQQIYGGTISTLRVEGALDPSDIRPPYGGPNADGSEVVTEFGGFLYAKDAEASTAFGTDVEKNAPTTDTTLFQTTTYGTPNSFARLSETDTTVLTDMAKFVENGEGVATGEDEEDLSATPWGNQLMKQSFSTGNGTKSQVDKRSEYDLTTGWKNALAGNIYRAGEDNNYRVGNVNVDFVATVVEDSDDVEAQPETKAPVEEIQPPKAPRSYTYGGGGQGASRNTNQSARGRTTGWQGSP